jgi:hypothetical protein
VVIELWNPTKPILVFVFASLFTGKKTAADNISCTYLFQIQYFLNKVTKKDKRDKVFLQYNSKIFDVMATKKNIVIIDICYFVCYLPVVITSFLSICQKKDAY